MLLSGPSDRPPAWTPISTNPSDIKNGPLANTGQDLIQVYTEFQAFQQSGKPVDQFQPSNKLIRVQNGMVGVDVRGSGDINALVTALSKPEIGMVVQASDAGTRMVEGYVPINNLTKAAALKTVVGGQSVQTVGIDPNYKPITFSVGSANNQAEDVFNLPQARQQYPGIDGTGITVGVLSDSANRFAGGLNDSIASGDLPAMSRITVVQDEAAGGSNTDEGRAMMELVHDLAPGADLAFNTGFGGLIGMADGIRNLSRVADAQVIVDDVGYANEPYFQPSPVEQAITDVVRNDNRIYFSSAGNSADKGFASPFRATTATVGGISGTFMDFDPSSAVLAQMPITVNTAGDLFFQYDQPFYTTNGVTSDVDILVLDTNGNIVAQGNSNNIASQSPLESVTIPNAGSYTVAVLVKSGPAPGRIQFNEFNSDIDFSKQFNNQGGITYPTSTGHNAGIDVVSTGAVPFFNAPPFGNQSPLQNEDFSSHGPRYVVFDAAGNRLPGVQTLQRPVLSGIDGVNTSFFPPDQDITQDPDSLPNFFGTSAAAPNLASLAALMRQISPDVSQDEVVASLKSSALPLNGSATGEWDVQGGFGLPQATAAFQAVDRLRVKAVNIPVGSTLQTPFKELSFVLNKKVDPSTLQDSDLVINQTPPGVTVTPHLIFFDDATNTVVFGLTFNHDPNTKINGTYAYTLADGSITSTDGKQLVGFSGNFTLADTTAPRVTNTVISARTITVTFSEPMDPATINSSTIFLSRTGSSGVFNNPSNVLINLKASYDPRTNSAIIDLSDVPQSQLPSDRYALIITDKVRDQTGNRLDGEFSGLFPSGNGTEGGTFNQDFGHLTLTAPHVLAVGLTMRFDTGMAPDQNTRAIQPMFTGRVSASFPGAVAGLTVAVQFNALHGDVFDLAQGGGGRGFTGNPDIVTTTDANGNFSFRAPATLPDGFHTVRVIVVGQPDQPPLPGLSTQFDQSFRIDTSHPLLLPDNVPDGALLSTLQGGITLNAIDPVTPSDLNNPLGVPTQFLVPTLDPATATNISNYALINLGPDRVPSSDDVDYSRYITGATYTDTTNRPRTIDWYTGQVKLSFAQGLPAGYYMLVARTPQPGFQGITDAAGNGLDGQFGVPGLEDFQLKFNYQPVATYVTDVEAISPKGNGTVASGPRSYFEVAVPGTTPRAEAPPTEFHIDFSQTLPDIDYSDRVWLIRSADSPTASSDGDFGLDPTFSSGVGYTRVTGVTVTLENSRLIGGGDPSVPGFQNRLVLKLAPGTTLPPDKYRLYIPNQILPDGRDLRIFDVYGNQIDGEFLGNPKPNGQGWETLLPTGRTRDGLSGDLVPGGSFETGYVVVPNGNVVFARPDATDDPFRTSDDPDGSRERPFPTLAPEALPNAANGGDLNSVANFNQGFNANLDINGNGQFDRSAFFAASQLSAKGPVVVVALPPNPGDPQHRTFVLQKPSQNPSLPSIPDGSASVPFNTLLSFQPGSILKMRDASLYVQNQGSAIQFNGGPNPSEQVYITSYLDDSVGGDTNHDGAPRSQGGTGGDPFPGDFGGILLRNFDDTSNGGRPIPISPGPDDPLHAQVDGRTKLGISGADSALSNFNFGTIRYGGGAVPESIGYRFDAITLFNSRPTITNMMIDGFQNPNGGPGPNGGSQGGISGDMDSFREDELARGPLVRRTTVQRTSLNGIYVRAELNGVIEPSDSQFLPDNPSTLGGLQNYTFDDPLPYLVTARMDIGSKLQHNTGLNEVSFADRVYVQPGMVFKFQRGSAIDMTIPGASLNIGDRTYINEYDKKPDFAPTDADYVPENSGDARIIFTSFFDDNATTSYVDPNTGALIPIVPKVDSDNGTSNLPTPGNVPDLARWGSISINSGAVAVIDEAEFRYGGGTVNTPSGTIGQRDVLALQNAGGATAFGVPVFDQQPLGFRTYITNNNFYDNQEAPISADVNGLLAADPLRPLISGNPFFRGNIMQRNDINALEVVASPQNRGGLTVFGYPANLSVDSVWDDTDLTYALRTTIILDGAVGFAGMDSPVPGGFPIPSETYSDELKPYVSLTIQSSLPDTLLANGQRIAKPGESALVKLLNDPTVPPIGDGTDGMPSGDDFADTRGGAGFLVGIDDGVDPTTDPLVDPGVMSQIRILGIGGNETTGQPRVPVIITSLRDDSVGKTVRGVKMNSAIDSTYLTNFGYTGTTPQAGDGGVIGFGAHSLSDYNLYDPRDGNLIDNADIRYLTRIELQGGGWAYSDNGSDGATPTDKLGTNNPLHQFNTAKAMTISNSNLSSFSQAGVVAHPSGVGQIAILLHPTDTTFVKRDGQNRGQPILLNMVNNTVANMPIGVRMDSETVNNDQGPSPQVGIFLNNTFYNNGVALDMEAVDYNTQNSLSHIYWLGMDNIFANSTDVAVRTRGQNTGSQLLYNLFDGNNNNVDTAGTQFLAGPFNAQPIFGKADFRDAANGNFALLASSDAIDAALSEVTSSGWGRHLQPIADQRLDGSGGVRNTTGRDILGDFGSGRPGDIVTLPGFSPDLRGFYDQWIPVIPGSAGAIPGPASNGGVTFSYKPISGERDDIGFLRQDTPGRSNVGFGSRPFFDVGAAEYRELFPPHITDVRADVRNDDGSISNVDIYAVTTAGQAFAGTNKGPQAITIKLDQRMDPSTINNQTILLQASGGDGIFGNNNNSQDRFINLSGKISYDAATSTITIQLASLGLNLTSDLYRIIARGSGDPVLRNQEQGLPLDGENTVGGDPNGAQLPLPSGNGVPGGDFYVNFTIDTNPPAVVPGTLHLATQAAPDPRPNDNITSNPKPTFTGQITDVSPLANPVAGQTVILQIYDPTIGNFKDVGTATTDAQGFFSVTSNTPLSDSPSNAGPDGILGTSDDSGYSIARVIVVDQSGNRSNPEADYASSHVWFILDTKGPRVAGTDPLPGSQAPVGANGTVQVAIAVNENLDPSSLTTANIRVSRSGGDGIFGNSNDVVLSLVPGSIREEYLKTASGAAILRFTINGVNTNDLYRVTLVGSGQGIRDIAGNFIDGENIQGFPSGNGSPGGDFNLDFVVYNPSFSHTVWVGPNSNPNPTGTRSDPYSTINDGLAAAGIGDTVAVLAGSATGTANVYNESVVMKSLVKLVSADPSSTAGNIIPGQPLKAIIRPNAASGQQPITIQAYDLVSTPAFQTEIRGFTIAAPLTGNSQTGSIIGNSFGISVINADILIDRNYIIDAGTGIAVGLGGASRAPRIENNGIIGNTNGVVVNGSVSQITTFQGAQNAVELANNTFAYNTSGLVVSSLANQPMLADVVNNLFWQNAARSTTRNGLAIFASVPNKLRVRNNLFSQNGPSVSSPADDVLGVGGGFNASLLTTTPDANGNLTGDVRFVNPLDPRPEGNGPGNFYLGASYDLTSGATGAIDNALNSAAPTTDFLFRNRVDIPGRGFAGPADIGAFELNGTGGPIGTSPVSTLGPVLNLDSLNYYHAPGDPTLGTGVSAAQASTNSVTVTFAQPVDRNSVQATDLLLSGNGLDASSPAVASSLNWVDNRTVQFNLTGEFRSTGTVSLDIPPGAIQNANGTLVPNFHQEISTPTAPITAPSAPGHAAPAQPIATVPPQTAIPTPDLSRRGRLLAAQREAQAARRAALAAQREAQRATRLAQVHPHPQQAPGGFLGRLARFGRRPGRG